MFKPASIPPSLRGLLAQAGHGELLFPLDAGNECRFPALPPLEPGQFADCRLPEEARAGLLLYLGWGGQSHSVSQDLGSKEGSYWHGIYHRMEPDDWNAKYWLRRVGPHQIGPSLAEWARQAGWDPGKNWDHERFVDYVSDARASKNQKKLEIAERVQLAEWQLLFGYCAKEKSE
ncbi:hypothetical protein [Bryobacter aggregatus]|uniref:hypothetical protein n=1 Tax=Bryobacter aggregatus TaxID=360054 RepID=UPI00068EEF07|nr:hypothetical protein [Bryobacter aggregatus]